MDDDNRWREQQWSQRHIGLCTSTNYCPRDMELIVQSTTYPHHYRWNDARVSNHYPLRVANAMRAPAHQIMHDMTKCCNISHSSDKYQTQTNEMSAQCIAVFFVLFHFPSCFKRTLISISAGKRYVSAYLMVIIWGTLLAADRISDMFNSWLPGQTEQNTSVYHNNTYKYGMQVCIQITLATNCVRNCELWASFKLRAPAQPFAKHPKRLQFRHILLSTSARAQEYFNRPRCSFDCTHWCYIEHWAHSRVFTCSLCSRQIVSFIWASLSLQCKQFIIFNRKTYKWILLWTEYRMNTNATK